MFKIEAHYKSEFQGGSEAEPMMIEVSSIVATADVARDLAAQFPKSVKLRGGGISGCSEGSGYISLLVDLRPNGSNGGINETGLRRYRSFRKTCAKLGLETAWGSRSRNSYPTEAALEAALAGVGVPA